MQIPNSADSVFVTRTASGEEIQEPRYAVLATPLESAAAFDAGTSGRAVSATAGAVVWNELHAKIAQSGKTERRMISPLHW